MEFPHMLIQIRLNELGAERDIMPRTKRNVVEAKTGPIA